MVLTTTALLTVQLMLAAQTPPKVDTAAWEEHKSKSGITLKAPPSFIKYDTNSAEFKDVIEKTRENNSFVANLHRTAPNYDLYMFDSSAEGMNSGYTDNLNISLNTGGAAINSDEMLKAVGDQVVSSLPSDKPIKYELVTLPAGRALRYWGEMKMTTPEGATIRPGIVGYFLTKGDQIIVLTMGTRQGNLSKAEPVFKKIAESLKIK